MEIFTSLAILTYFLPVVNMCLIQKAQKKNNEYFVYYAILNNNSCNIILDYDIIKN